MGFVQSSLVARPHRAHTKLLALVLLAVTGLIFVSVIMGGTLSRVIVAGSECRPSTKLRPMTGAENIPINNIAVDDYERRASLQFSKLFLTKGDVFGLRRALNRVFKAVNICVDGLAREYHPSQDKIGRF